MSYHRVLPRPLPLSNEDLASQWTAGQDPLKTASIMMNENVNAGHTTRGLNSSSSKDQDSLSRSSAMTYSQIKTSSPESEAPKVDTDKNDQHPGLNQKPTSSAVEAWEGDIPGPICLCQPDPKVPRPRNAFILYRQHHQASIVAQNPGLPNPEISKVIGDHWRASPPEVKEHWKSLAEEEKIRHQKQYPDYRYQPRRAGRVGSVTDNPHGSLSSLNEVNRCAKCGGKSISSSHMISTNASISAHGSPGFSPSNTQDSSHSMPPPPTTSTPAIARLTRNPVSPATRDGLTHSYRFNHPQSAHILPLTSPRHIKRPQELLSPSLQDSKRRRVPHSAYGQPKMSQGPQTPSQLAQMQQRRNSLSYPDVPPGTLSSPSAMSIHSSLANGQSRLRADSLRLPPLYTPVDSHVHSRSESDDSTNMKTLEAMIHSIPLLGKIRLLGKVAGPPPLTPCPQSPLAFERRKGRGPIICIDAVDPESVNLITDVLERNLESECDLKVFSVQGLLETEKATMQSYLRLIDKFHDLSKEVIAHVASPTIVGSDKVDRKMSTVSRQLSKVDLEKVGKQEENMDTAGESPLSPKTAPDLRADSVDLVKEADGNIDMEEANSKEERLPVALLPGWHLTQTDLFATNVPINDAYSPVDHWQWHLTFWRGIVGADATVAVQPAIADEMQGSPPVTASSNVSMGVNTAGSGPESGRSNAANTSQRKSGGGIDIRLEDSKAIILQANEKGTVVESALRRVGFEIGEWIRGWNERESI